MAPIGAMRVNMFPYSSCGLPTSEITIAEQTRAAGYMNGVFGWYPYACKTLKLASTTSHVQYPKSYTLPLRIERRLVNVRASININAMEEKVHCKFDRVTCCVHTSTSANRSPVNACIFKICIFQTSIPVK